MTMTTMEATDRTAIMERMATTTAGATTANKVSTPAKAMTVTTIRAAAGCLRSATASDRFGPALDFGLPDRHDPFDFIHGPLARRERLRPVDSRACDRDGIAADRDATKTVDDGHLRNPELFLRLFRERGQALDRHRPIDFVVERPDALVRAHRSDGPRGLRPLPSTAGGRGPRSRLAGAGAPRSGVPGRRRGPPRASVARPPSGGRRGTGRLGPAGRRAPRNARNTGTVARGSPSW